MIYDTLTFKVYSWYIWITLTKLHNTSKLHWRTFTNIHTLFKIHIHLRIQFIFVWLYPLKVFGLYPNQQTISPSGPKNLYSEGLARHSSAPSCLLEVFISLCSQLNSRVCFFLESEHENHCYLLKIHHLRIVKLSQLSHAHKLLANPNYNKLF